MRKIFCCGALAAVAFIMIVGVCWAEAEPVKKSTYYKDQEILITKVDVKDGELEFSLFEVQVGNVTFVLTYADKRSEAEIEKLKRTARSAKQQDFQDFIAWSLQQIPKKDQGGEVFRDICEKYYIYFAPSEGVYFLIADTSSREALMKSHWTTKPPTPNAAHALWLRKN